MSENYILLKWGTLKGWNLVGNDKAIELLRQYGDLGSSMSAMTQHDTPEQKKLLCELINIHTGTIQNDWNGEEYSKEKAIDYIMKYGTKD